MALIPMEYDGGGIVEEAISGTTDANGRLFITVNSDEAVIGGRITSVGGMTCIYGITPGGSKYLLLLYYDVGQVKVYASQSVSGYVTKLKI